MHISGKPATSVLLALLFSVSVATSASAHLMVAQRGTVRVVDDGAYMVLSLPVSAFDGVDEDGDGMLSTAEFTSHRHSIIKAVNNQVKLQDKTGARPLKGMMLTPVLAHGDASKRAEQLVVMGKFDLTDTNGALRFSVGLFGTQTAEQTFTIGTSDPAQSKAHKLVLTPEHPDAELFLKAEE